VCRPTCALNKPSLDISVANSICGKTTQNHWNFMSSNTFRKGRSVLAWQTLSFISDRSKTHFVRNFFQQLPVEVVKPKLSNETSFKTKLYFIVNMICEMVVCCGWLFLGIVNCQTLFDLVVVMVSWELWVFGWYCSDGECVRYWFGASELRDTGLWCCWFLVIVVLTLVIGDCECRRRRGF